MGKFEEMRAKAEFLDARDPLGTFRERFVIPQGRVYMDGNSLGSAPRKRTDWAKKLDVELRDLSQKPESVEVFAYWMNGKP